MRKPEETDEQYLARRTRERHDELLLTRFIALAERGYTPDWPRSNPHEIHLQHPDKRAVPVNLWSNGWVVDQYPSRFTADEDRTIIEEDHKEAFERFIGRQPKPTWWQRLRSTRLENAFFVVLVYSIFIALASSLSWCADQLFDRGR